MHILQAYWHSFLEKNQPHLQNQFRGRRKSGRALNLVQRIEAATGLSVGISGSGKRHQVGGVRATAGGGGRAIEFHRLADLHRFNDFDHISTLLGIQHLCDMHQGVHCNLRVTYDQSANRKNVKEHAFSSFFIK